MKQGFIKVAAVTVDIRVADVWHSLLDNESGEVHEEE